jgi:methylenetetrahydrofolate reductase (NADPH)
VTEFHFYTMNRADLVFAICRLLGVRPPAAEKVIGEAEPQVSLSHRERVPARSAGG